MSSSEIRSERSSMDIGIIGTGQIAEKYARECKHVNGISPFLLDKKTLTMKEGTPVALGDELTMDAFLIASDPDCRANQVHSACSRESMFCATLPSLSLQKVPRAV